MRKTRTSGLSEGSYKCSTFSQSSFIVKAFSPAFMQIRTGANTFYPFASDVCTKFGKISAVDSKVGSSFWTSLRIALAQADSRTSGYKAKSFHQPSFGGQKLKFQSKPDQSRTRKECLQNMAKNAKIWKIKSKFTRQNSVFEVKGFSVNISMEGETDA